MAGCLSRSGAMEEPTAVSRLDSGTLFKIVFWVGICLWFAFALLVAIIALLMPSAIAMNGVKAMTPMEALPAAPYVFVLDLIMTSVFAALGSGLLRLAGRRLPLGYVREATQVCRSSSGPTHSYDLLGDVLPLAESRPNPRCAPFLRC